MTNNPQTDLRTRIAEALYTHDHPGHLVPLGGTGMGPAYRESADAVLAVLPAVPVPPTTHAAVRAFVLWLDASDGSVPTHDGVHWPDGTATVHHRHFGHTTTHATPEAACQAAHGKQGRLVWPDALLRRMADEAQQQPDTETRTDIQVWPLRRVLNEVQCGSQDWSWEQEWADLDRRHAETGYLAKLEQQIRENGITMPVLIGSDGRLWDGHHRLRLAVRIGIGYVPVEVVPPAVPGPGRVVDEEQGETSH